MTDEEWRTIPSFPSYEASNLGRIRRVASFRCHGHGGILKLSISKQTGYYKATLIGPDGGRRHVNTHTVVCEAFHGPRPAGMQCAHNDGSRTNNMSINLRWATPQENQNDRVRHGTAIRGEQVANAKLTSKSVSTIRLRRKRGERCIDLGIEFGVSPDAISKICNGRNWRHL